MPVKITWKLHGVCFIAACSITAIMKKFVDESIDNLLTIELLTRPTNNIIINFYTYLFVISIMTIVIHELLHGLAYKVFGGKVKFGFKIVCAYTQEVSGLALKRNKFLVVLLLPLFILSILFLTIQLRFCKMAFFINLVGSTGDFIMFLQVLGLSSKDCIVDRNYGYDVILSEK